MTDNKTAFEGALPNPFILERADPQITRHTDGRYYFTATVPAYDRIVLRGADTLLGLRDAEETTIWVQHPDGPMGSHIWAPELHWIDGAWYVYFAAGEAESATADVWRIRMYVLENRNADPLTGEWTEKGQIATPIDSFSLDATTFAHNGTRYLCWAQHDPAPPKAPTRACSSPNSPNPWTVKGAPVELSRPELPWETIRFAVNEGPYAIVRNGKVFITYSAAGTGAEYCMGLLTADADADLLDPGAWTKHPDARSSPPARPTASSGPATTRSPWTRTGTTFWSSTPAPTRRSSATRSTTPTGTAACSRSAGTRTARPTSGSRFPRTRACLGIPG